MIQNPRLPEVWLEQDLYNQRIKRIQQRTDPDWMINYILGCISELGELLREMNWRDHRLHNTQEFGPNVTEELADITKYVFSMWQILGYSHQDMLYFMHKKGLVLNQIYQQEHMNPPKDEKILILDLDGVVADFRMGFTQWLQTSKWRDELMPNREDFGLHMDINNGWDYSVYEQAKLEFEHLGGYNFLPPMKEVVDAVIELKKQSYMIIAWTARPQSTYKRIWSDTWLWLIAHDIHVDALHFGNEERVLNACNLKLQNEVIALEDNPILAQRYAASQIPVVIVTQPYNEDHPADPHIWAVNPKQNSYVIARDIVNLSKSIYQKIQKEQKQP